MKVLQELGLPVHIHMWPWKMRNKEETQRRQSPDHKGYSHRVGCSSQRNLGLSDEITRQKTLPPGLEVSSSPFQLRLVIFINQCCMLAVKLQNTRDKEILKAKNRQGEKIKNDKLIVDLT